MTSTTLRDREPTRTGYRLETVSQAFERVQHGEDPWIAIGDFLDDWGRAEKDKRRLLVSAPIILKLDDPEIKSGRLCSPRSPNGSAGPAARALGPLFG